MGHDEPSGRMPSQYRISLPTTCGSIESKREMIWVSARQRMCMRSKAWLAASVALRASSPVAPASRVRRSHRLRSTLAAAPGLLAHALDTKQYKLTMKSDAMSYVLSGAHTGRTGRKKERASLKVTISSLCGQREQLERCSAKKRSERSRQG